MENQELDIFKKNIIDLYKKDSEEIEFLRETCPKLFDAMDYSFEAGGKRLRPYLMYETFRFFGAEEKEDFLIKPFMLAIEMIHTFSLIHDDLPSIDNDELRRGKESTWKKFGEDIALLTGDALIFRAFSVINYLQEQIAQFILTTNTKDKNFFIDLNYRIAKSKSILSDDAGLHGMVLGETIDTIGKELIQNEEDLLFMYECKTSALIAASFKIGACIAGATNTELEKMNALGSYVGKAFQIQDDILDVISSDEELGKPVGSDSKNGKTTYITLTSLEEARHEVEHLSHHALEILEDLEKIDSKRNKSKLQNIILKLIHRKV